MHRPNPLNTKTLSTPNFIRLLPWRRDFLLISLALALAWLAVSPVAQAQLPSPSPDGGYPGENTAEGTDALKHVKIGSNGIADGTENTAIGFEALYNNTTGLTNTATGSVALFSNTTGYNNTANGSAALNENTTGYNNTANGVDALSANTTANNNTATGTYALSANTTGTQNTATGVSALFYNNGDNNTATGANALHYNDTGNNNTANGVSALQRNTGSNNTANGVNALSRNTTGSNNIALGFNAGANLTTGSNNIDVGGRGLAAEANTIRIGKSGIQQKTFIAGIFGSTVASGAGVIVNSSGQLGTVLSSERFKEAIKPMDKVSEAILSLQPVSFRYKNELDPNGFPQFGLIAEQVDKVNPDLVIRGEDGRVMTVRYEAVNAMLLNEFLKEHRTVEEQGETIAQQKKDFESKLARQQKAFEAKFAQQQKQIEALTATVREVSDQLALNKPELKLVATP